MRQDATYCSQVTSTAIDKSEFWLPHLSSLELIPPLVLAKASSSSMKIIQGEFVAPRWNRSLTLAAPRPTNISTKSLAEQEIKATPDSAATARASSVLPVPDGPVNTIKQHLIQRWNSRVGTELQAVPPLYPDGSYVLDNVN